MLRSFFKSPLYWITLLYIIVPAYAVFWILGKPLLGTDDANIYFEYARNITSGNGIVYNIGGEHVEGFSSPLYLAIVSLFHLLSSKPEPLILLFNLCMAIASGILLTSVLLEISRKVGISNINQALIVFTFLFWIFINPAFYGWSIVSLMDSGLYMFLLVFSYAYFIRMILKDEIGRTQSIQVSLLIFLIILSRPEGPMWAGSFLFIYFLLCYRVEQTLQRALKSVLIPLATCIVTMLSVTLYRLSYYGYPLPNTYYAKTSASFSATLKDGWKYFSDFIEMYSPLFLLPVLVLCFWLLYQLKKNNKTPLFYVSLITLIFVFLGLAAPILEGGDYTRAFRFYQSVYPFLILPYLLLLFVFKKAGSFKPLLINVVLVCVVLSWFNQADWNHFYVNNNSHTAPQDKDLCMSIEFNLARSMRKNGRRLNVVFKDQLPVIGFSAAGGIAVGYDGIVYDMMGLNLTKLAHADPNKTGPKAHQSFNKKVFYELSPDILMPNTELSNQPFNLLHVRNYYSNTNNWENLIYKNIFNDDEFKQRYTLAVVLNKAHPAYVCYGYFHNSFLEKLSKRNQFLIRTLTY